MKATLTLLIVAHKDQEPNSSDFMGVSEQIRRIFIREPSTPKMEGFVGSNRNNSDQSYQSTTNRVEFIPPFFT